MQGGVGQASAIAACRAAEATKRAAVQSTCICQRPARLHLGVAARLRPQTASACLPAGRPRCPSPRRCPPTKVRWGIERARNCNRPRPIPPCLLVNALLQHSLTQRSAGPSAGHANFNEELSQIATLSRDSRGGYDSKVRIATVEPASLFSWRAGACLAP